MPNIIGNTPSQRLVHVSNQALSTYTKEIFSIKKIISMKVSSINSLGPV